MNKFIFLCLILVSPLSFAQEKSDMLYECSFKVTALNGRPDFVMSGYLVDRVNEPDMRTYLTFEPPIIADIPVSARILLTRFEGEDYYPMTLHPRGNTAAAFVHARLEGQSSQSLSYSDSMNSYALSCFKLRNL